MYSWGSWHTLVPLILGDAGLVSFSFHEVMVASQPLVPIVIFDNNQSRGKLCWLFPPRRHSMFCRLIFTFILRRRARIQPSHRRRRCLPGMSHQNIQVIGGSLQHLTSYVAHFFLVEELSRLVKRVPASYCLSLGCQTLQSNLILQPSFKPSHIVSEDQRERESVCVCVWPGQCSHLQYVEKYSKQTNPAELGPL
jgi:hypothetical protein